MPTATPLEEVLPLMLHILDQRDVCALLCVSRAMVTGCEGCLSWSFAPTSLDQVHSFALWLRQHGDLLQSLKFCPNMPWHGPFPAYSSWQQQQLRVQRPPGMGGGPQADNAAAATALASGLIGAIAKLQRLRSFTCLQQEAVLPPLLQALPDGISSLDLRWDRKTTAWYRPCGEWPLPNEDLEILAKPLADCLRRLPDLKSLCVKGFREDGDPPQPISPGVFAALPKLQELEVHGFAIGPELLQALPTGLRRLTAHDWEPQEPVAFDIDLSHLTLLTYLSLDGKIVFSETDALPPNLVVLHSSQVEDMRLLRPLTRLREWDHWLTAEELLAAWREAPQLTYACLLHDCSAGLQEARGALNVGDGGLGEVIATLNAAGVADIIGAVGLQAGGVDEVDESGGGNGTRVARFGPALLQPLAALPGMTSLHIKGMQPTKDGLAALSSLSSLQKLGLETCQLGHKQSRGGAAVLWQLPAVLQALPQLQQLVVPSCVWEVPMPQAAQVRRLFEGIAALTQLRSLRIPTPTLYNHGDLGYEQAQRVILWEQVHGMLAGATQLTQLEWESATEFVPPSG